MEIAKQTRARAVASIQRYADENFAEPLGEMAAGLLLDFMLEEIGPVIYNKAIQDAQTRMQLRVADLTGELFADEFQYWPKAEARRKSRR